MKLFSYINKRVFVLFLGGMLINSGIILMKPLLLARLLNIQEADLNLETIGSFVSFGFILHFLFYSAMLIANYTSNQLQYSVLIRLKDELLQKLFLNQDYINDEKVSIMTQDIEFLYENYLLPLDLIVGKFFLLMATMIFILKQNMFLGTVFIVFSFLRPLPQWVMNDRLKKSGQDFSNRQRRFHVTVGDFFRGEETFRYNGVVREQLQFTNKMNLLYEESRKKNEWVSNIIYFFNGPLEFISQVLPLGLGLFLQTQGVNITSVSLVAMYIATLNLGSPLQTILYSFSDIQRSKVIREKIFRILEKEDMSYQLPRVQAISRLVVKGLGKRIGERTLFEDISFCLEKNEKLLIKGASGSGKSSLLRLLARLDHVDSGEIYVECSDGTICTDYISNLAYLSQNPFFVHGTIRENLNLGQQFSDATLLTVLERVGLVEEIDDILNYNLVNNGANISGGQKLRLELARFLIRQKDIVLADEITAALDRENAEKVRQIVYSLPVILIEVAHVISDESGHDYILEL
ncbi:ABC-type multidrug transport system fused ATPase/permease subunit [Streptococcus rupicaprae]|uniref:ABC-type multidrug transport system fused ATPase/permease subunit n=1 Tax=Streptococcus rupicaprae TaxID=759619 RepID=A0ABV2FKU3_9STRE